ncbi:MAG TPA: type II toxin-antitoxin system RelB/DinJ family antitoxin [Candidatus Paceibacterota bacterium]
MNTTINIRIDQKLKDKISKKFKKSGLNLSSGTKFVFTQIANNEIDLIPNMHYEMTPKQERWVMRQVVEAKKGKMYKSIEELHRDILDK